MLFNAYYPLLSIDTKSMHRHTIGNTSKRSPLLRRGRFLFLFFGWIWDLGTDGGGEKARNLRETAASNYPTYW